MRTVLTFCATVFGVALLGSAASMSPVRAQSPENDPSLILPDEPQSDGVLPELPLPPGDDGNPMVRPAPDAAPDLPPEAFGGELGAESQDESAAAPVDANEDETGETLDSLFAELRRTADQQDAQRIADRIERRWRDSGSATVNLLMRRAAQSMGRQNEGQALDILDQALMLDPAFAEAWNRRATVHFASGEYGKSIADIEQTLALEPRHWGAMMGLALMLEETDQDERALDVYQQVLAVYPTLRSAQEAAGRLAEKLTGPAI